MDLKNMMKQVQDIQGRINGMQSELAEKTVETSSGGGMVTVTANGKQEIISINISPEIIDPSDISMLQDLITAAVNAALKSSKDMMQEELSKITGGIKIPGLNL
jgi:DNA-binding YbaB/EbfC family protein